MVKANQLCTNKVRDEKETTTKKVGHKIYKNDLFKTMAGKVIHSVCKSHNWKEILSQFLLICALGEKRHCHSIRFGFEFSNYRLFNNEKTSILTSLEKASMYFE